MGELKCTAVWLVLLQVHFNLQFVSSSPIPLSSAAPTNPPPAVPDLVLCPQFPPAECPPEEVWDNECMTDMNCTEMHPGHQFKCCDVGCQYRCIPPDKVKLPTFLPLASQLQVKGTCPVFPVPAECPEQTYDECINDQQCAEFYPGLGFKCCQDGCGMLCLPPEQKQTSTTPPPTYPYTLTCPHLPPAECPPEEVWNNECKTDLQCAELYPGQGFKCCKEGCEYRCMKPVRENLTTHQPIIMPVYGTCPAFVQLPECPPDPEHECSNDKDCAELYGGLGMTKCCLGSECEMICVTPVQPPTPPANSKCPSSPTPDECPPEKDLVHECKDDAKCNKLYPGSGLKCCKDGCYNTCVAPVDENAPTTPPPTYPYTLTCPHFPPAECPPEEVWDNECKTDLKCAELYPGQGLKCCKEGCEYRCMKPVREKLTTHQPIIMPVYGTCPAFVQLPECPPDPEHECSNDKDCVELYPGLGMNKCCRGSECEMICVKPVQPTYPANSTCPSSPTPDECPPKPDDECNNVDECAEMHPGQGLKCCRDGCDMRCVAPVQGHTPTTRPPTSPVNGTCPVFPIPPECPPEPDDECNNDQECAKLYLGSGMKCCQNGCHFRCVSPV